MTVGLGIPNNIFSICAMIRPYVTTSLLIASSLLLASCTEKSSAPESESTLYSSDEYISSPNLVDSHWLQENLNSSSLHILELGRTQDEFLLGHIPGAQFIDWREDISDPSAPDRYNLLPQTLYEQLLRRLGIREDSTVILYDSMDNRASVRMFWIMKYYNHPDVKILDGGLSAWERSHYPLNNQPENRVESSYSVSATNPDFLVDFDFVSDNLSNTSVKVVDGRPFDQYTGDSAGKVFHTGIEHQRIGHIYGAESVPWADNLRADGTFKPPEELAEIYAKHHILNQGTVVTYCNEGLHAAMPWFVLHELLGFDDVRLYDDSMAEWANVFDTPMITGERCM